MDVIGQKRTNLTQEESAVWAVGTDYVLSDNSSQNVKSFSIENYIEKPVIHLDVLGSFGATLTKEDLKSMLEELIEKELEIAPFANLRGK